MSIAPPHIERQAVPDDIAEVERLTWCRLRWPIGDGSATRVRSESFESDSIAIPLVNVAAWIVENWWSILYELARVSDAGTQEDSGGLDSHAPGWRSRHSLRVADSSLLLPDLRIFSSGRNVTWQLRADHGQLFRAVPDVRFVDDTLTVGSREESVASLGELVSWTLSRLTNCDGADVSNIREAWDFISRTPSRSSQAEFCRAAGRLGLDPHDVESWPQGICEWLEEAPAGTLDTAFSADILSFSNDVTDLPGIDRALRALVRDSGLRERPTERTRGSDASIVRPDSTTAFALGYERAERLRWDAHVDSTERLPELERVLHAAYGQRLVHHQRLVVPAPVSAAAGWSSDGVDVITRPDPTGQRSRSRRFALARGLHHALWLCDEGARLATDAADDDQRASRAFAAELLAPRREVFRLVAERRKIMPEIDAVAEVASLYDVDPVLARNQFDNARAGR